VADGALTMTTEGPGDVRPIEIEADGVVLKGDLGLLARPRGLAVFAHGSGSGRNSPRNRRVAEDIRRAGVATLLFDLLTADEESIDDRTRHLRFDIALLARRLAAVTVWAGVEPDTRGLRVGYFGASTGAAAALVAAAQLPGTVHAVVSRGGRPDLAGDFLAGVRAPTLLIVGGDDEPVIGLNREAFDLLRCEKELVIVPGASHLFEEPGTLEEVSRLAAAWLVRRLG
jgi:putative phosphoribosyl transferase